MTSHQASNTKCLTTDDCRLTTVMAELRAAVNDAAAFLGGMDADFCDEHQSARQVLSHLVFWHREYVTILQALCRGQEPPLKSGKFRELNERATVEFQRVSMPTLARRFCRLQNELEQVVNGLPNPQVKWTFKQGSTQFKPSEVWLTDIIAHIRNHTRRQKRAYEHARKKRGV